MSLDEQIQKLGSDARARIDAADGLDMLEAVRVDVLGRKGSLAQISKEFGKLTAEARASAGKALNAAKQELETAFEARKEAFSERSFEPAAAYRMGGSHAARAGTAAGESASGDADPERNRGPVYITGLRGAGWAGS